MRASSNAGGVEVPNLLPLEPRGAAVSAAAASRISLTVTKRSRVYLLVHAVLPVFSRDGRPLHPGTHRVLVEIRAGADALVHVCGSKRARRCGTAAGRCPGGESKQDGENQADASHVVTSTTTDGVREPVFSNLGYSRRSMCTAMPPRAGPVRERLAGNRQPARVAVSQDAGRHDLHPAG